MPTYVDLCSRLNCKIINDSLSKFWVDGRSSCLNIIYVKTGRNHFYKLIFTNN